MSPTSRHESIRVGNDLRKQFNSPIGYFKNPLLYNSGPAVSDFEIDESTGDRHAPMREVREERTSAKTGPETRCTGGMSLERLPLEVKLRIANELSQFDCLNLMKTSKSMYFSTLPRLYQHIIVDQNYSQFSKEYDFRYFYKPDDQSESEICSCSYIKSPYNFKRFISQYLELHDNFVNRVKEFSKYNGDFMFPSIKHFKCIEIPDSLNTYDYDLSSNLLSFFSRLESLHELVWLNDNFRVEYLTILPNYESITDLMINIKFSNYLNDFSWVNISQNNDRKSTTNTGKSSRDKMLNFINVTNFQIRPFLNSRRLSKIIDGLLVGDNADRISDNLKTLRLARFDKDTNALVPGYKDLVSYTEESSLSDLDLGTIKSIFINSKLKRLNNLTNLSLNNCLLMSEEANILIDSINLQQLKVLELKNISEYRILNRVNDQVESIRSPSGDTHHTQDETTMNGEQSFIQRIAPYLYSLRHLRIDYRECLTDTVPGFLEKIPSEQLMSLDVTVRYNSSKLHIFSDSIDNLLRAYAAAIISGNKRQTLRKLCVEIKEENAFCDINMPLPLNLFYEEIRQCTNLRSLRLNPGDAQNPDKVVALIEHLSHLDMLDVFGSQAGGAPHFGLGMVHPTIFDEWFKVQHVALLFLRHNPAIKYIRINKCIFECFGASNKVNPRDGIDRWFDSLVRVGGD
ncbi:Piso0_005625 [Millerozyma farinosa CBS 7064]|uniref:Piso0_005625 protein n=1 Tax=Pichia sorbitophila (strain ATCC MYA-4447 / BCRC 22081 / CBS 7064 / NBRC 10061 / NRRL Y-12695) TaxID=559304 RepID=G8XZH9_PICSO|nr:Piso0_005625 [Millerozyma farinosa CBS 7064]